MENEVLLYSLNPDTFQQQTYIESDVNLIAVSELDTVFSSSTDYIEFYVYDENQTKIYPSETIPLTSFNVKNGDVLLDPQSDLENLGYDLGVYNISYNFYRKRLASNINETYFISEISSDRTEVRLDSNIILNESIISSVGDFTSYRNASEYFVDFYLNFGNNNRVIANNIKLDTDTSDPTILIKLYEPLPEEYSIKDTLWVVEQISTSQAYQITFPFIPIIEDDFKSISGPNFNLDISQQEGNSSQLFSYNTLINSNVTSSVNQIKNLLSSKGINININYEDFSEFVNFSSAKTRLENFYYKVGLIESYTDSLSTITTSITGDTILTPGYSSSVASYQSKIDGIIQNFDGYEYFLYFNSGSLYSYPKSNTSPPFNLYPSDSTEVLDWIGSADPENPRFGGVALSASNYDQNNQDWLYFAIPEYLREDPENQKYELFVDMVGQHYDNIWVYIKDITNKFSADNRLEYGISKDLVADAIKDFGVKLYSNKYNNDDLYTAFLGLTPSGSLFPFPDMTGSLPTPSGYEYVDTMVSASNDAIPLSDVNKRLYKRIYHNLPYLLKTKGTAAGLRALITSYGIPDTILRINEFGGKDRNNYNDWDYGVNKFNYALEFDGSGYLTSSFDLNNNFSTESPKTLQFRFKTNGIPTGSNFDRSYQTLWMGNANTAAIVLEYTGSGYASGSYSGSISDPYNQYGTIKFMPESGVHPEFSASVYLPVFDGGWWSVMATLGVDGDINTATLHAANRIDDGIGFLETSSVTHTDTTNYWNSVITSSFPNISDETLDGITYKPFSGSYQEIRYYTEVLSGSLFEDYTVNPYSIEGNSGLTTPNSLAFRADLGTLLNTPNRISTHPKTTGSAQFTTSSFEGDDSSFYISGGTFTPNVEKIYLDQFPAGIKNRITDKIQIENHILPSGDTLSPIRSIQQTSYESSSYTPNVNYLEVALSPQDEINDDIIAQYGYFNMGDYIGDPRQISSSDRSYPDLDTVRDEYFKKYIGSYDLVDFVRLMKFFDNSLFKMVKDFIPARTSLSSGVVIKQHLLERNKQRPAQASWSDETYSGSVKAQSRNYNTGSGDVAPYEYHNGTSIVRFSGGTGGSFEKFNGLSTSPEASTYNLTNNYLLTQSFTESFDGPLGPRNITISNQEEFYDGEFSGSNIMVTDQILNPDCQPYLSVPDTAIRFYPIFFNDQINPFDGGTVNVSDWVNRKNSPLPGYAFLISEEYSYYPIFSSTGRTSDGRTKASITSLIPTFANKITHIKLARLDNSGIDVADYIQGSEKISFIFPEKSTSTEYYIEGIIVNAENVLLRINDTQGDFNVTSSYNGGSENWNLSASGNFTASGVDDHQSQGVFIRPVTHQEQFIQYWNGNVIDLNTVGGSPKFFNTGSSPSSHSGILDQSWFYNGSYNPKRTSNVPWLMSASIEYSASDTGAEGEIEVYGRLIHGGAYGVAGGTDQSFILNSPSSTPAYIATASFSLPTQNTFNPSIDISDEYFNWNVNNTIPGDSGSGAINAGNMQVISEGTSSLEWNFISQSVNINMGLASSFNTRTLEGSTTNPSNVDFTPSSFIPVTNGTAIIGTYFVSESTDGQYYINKTEVLNTYAINSYTVNIGAKIYYQYPLDWTGISANAYFQSSLDGISWSQTVSSVTLPNLNTPSTQITGSEFIPTYSTNSSLSGVYVRIVVEMPLGLDLEYNIEKNKSTWNVVQTSPIPPGKIAPPSTLFVDFQYNQLDTPNWNNITQAQPSINYKAKLMYTGSEGNTEITSSNIGTLDIPSSGDYTLTFPDSPITTNDHINTSQSMYYVEYEFYSGSASNVTITPKNNTLYPTLFVTQSIVGGEDYYELTGSLNIYRDNGDNLPLTAGNLIYNKTFNLNDSASIGSLTADFVYQGPFDYNDVFRVGVSVEKTLNSGLHITSYDFQIYPSSSIISRINGGASEYGVALYGQSAYGGSEDTLPVAFGNYSVPILTSVIIPTFFTSLGENILPFYLALDCQPLLNNYIGDRISTFLMDVDYTSAGGSIIPVNQQQILARTAVKASVPDSNYTSLKIINPRYNGSKTTSKYINKWSTGDKGTYGKLPTVELRNAYFGYFNSIEDPYPNINGTTKLNLNYLIDGQGNALPPSLSGLSKEIFERVFPQNSEGTLSISEGNKVLKSLNSPYPLVKVSSYPSPIMYSQTSSNGHASELPLTGSGRVSRFDNSDGTSVGYYSFTSMGTGSADTSVPTTTFDFDLKPSEEIIYNGSSIPTAVNPYTPSTGVISYPTSSPETSGRDLTNSQKIKLETSVQTSFIYDTDGVGREMNINLSLKTNGTNTPFVLEDIELIVHNEEKSYNLGSVLKEGWFNYNNSRPNSQLDNSNKISFSINYEMEHTLAQRGIYNGWGDANYKNPRLLSLEWVIKANSGDSTFKSGDSVKWNMVGFMKPTSVAEQPQTVFFPTFHQGEYLATKISTIGALDHVFATDNKAIAPYWVFGSQLFPSVSTPQNVLYMSSSNMNEAYGTEFYQGKLEYTPGPSEYFPGGQEPVGTQFDEIERPLTIKEGDEIRFSNNENYTYTILSVKSPQENIMSGNKGRIKITLDRSVPGDVNKNFFLVRRNIPDASSMYMDVQYPYINPPSASNSSGIIFPEYPALEMEASASAIVTDLISKGVIK